MTPWIRFLAGWHRATLLAQTGRFAQEDTDHRMLIKWILDQMPRPERDWRFRMALAHLYVQILPVPDWPDEAPFSDLLFAIGQHPGAGRETFAFFWRDLTCRHTNHLLNGMLLQGLTSPHREVTIVFGPHEVRGFYGSRTGSPDIKIPGSLAVALRQDIALLMRWGHPRLVPEIVPRCAQLGLHPVGRVVSPTEVTFAFTPDPHWLTRFRVNADEVPTSLPGARP